MDRGFTDGFLYVPGRFKSFLMADDGEKFSPEGIEEVFSQQCAFIKQRMMYNNRNPFSVLLVVPDKEAVKRWLAQLSTGNEEGRVAVLEEMVSQRNIII